MRLVRRKAGVAGLALALAAAGLAGCADAGTDVDGQVPSGVVVLDSGGNTVASASGGQVSGRITVGNGQERTFEVRLIGGGGAEIGLGGRYSLRARVLIAPLADVSVSGSNRIVVRGKSAGSTSLVLDVVDADMVVIGPLIPLTVS